MFDFAVKSVKVHQGHYLNDLGIILVPNATYQISDNRSIGSREKFLTLTGMVTILVMLPGLFSLSSR